MHRRRKRRTVREEDEDTEETEDKPTPTKKNNTKSNKQTPSKQTETTPSKKHKPNVTEQEPKFLIQTIDPGVELIHDADCTTKEGADLWMQWLLHDNVTTELFTSKTTHIRQLPSPLSPLWCNLSHYHNRFVILTIALNITTLSGFYCG